MGLGRGRGFWYRGFAGPFIPPGAAEVSPDKELDFLKAEAQHVREELEAIEARIQEIKKEAE